MAECSLRKIDPEKAVQLHFNETYPQALANQRNPMLFLMET